MNKTIIIGNLTRDPELKTVNAKGTQTSVCRMAVAVNERYGQNETTTYFEVSAWRGLGETCAKFLKKGQKVMVEGRISVSVYTGNDQQPHANLQLQADNIEFLSPKSEGGASAAPRAQAPAAQPNYDAPTAQANNGFTAIETDDLPF